VIEERRALDRKANRGRIADMKIGVSARIVLKVNSAGLIVRKPNDKLCVRT
jgi:hypothetical protein